MNYKDSQKTATQHLPWFVERAVDVASFFVFVSISIFAVGSAVFVFGFVVFKGEKSAEVAAWVQAIASPLAIAAAFLVARYQANRQERHAAALRQADHDKTAAVAVAQQRQARLDSIAVDGAKLVYAQGILIGSATTLETMRKIVKRVGPTDPVDHTHAEGYGLIIRRVARLDPASISSPGCQLAIINAIFLLDVAHTASRNKEGETAKDACHRADGAVAALVNAFNQIEETIDVISEELLANGRDAIEPVQPFTKKTWAEDWQQTRADMIAKRASGHPDVAPNPREDA